MNKELLLKTFRNTTGAVVYVFLVSQIMQNGERLFGNSNNILGPFAILLLFCLSAATVGGLILGLPIILFFNRKNAEGIQAAIYSIGWLGVYTILGFLILLILN